MLKVTLPSRSPLPPADRRIAIIGGGFTGATLARLLASRASGSLSGILIFEPRATLGTGLAYDTDDPNLRLNVAAHRMRAVPGDPRAFLNWLKNTGRLDADPQAEQGGMIYARRRDFGAFMQEQMKRDLQDERIQHITRKVLFIGRENGHWRIIDSKGETHAVDIVVIATSNPPASLPLDGEAASILRDIHELGRVGPDDRVVVAGSGLTAIDMLAALRERGHRGAMTVISRSGLLPRRQPDGDFTAHGETLFGQHRSATALLRAVRRAVDQVTADGLPWQSVMDALRHQAQELWSNMPCSQRKRVKRHLLRWYDVHRHRMPPALANMVASLQDEGRLTVMAACIRTIKADDKGVTLTLMPKGAALPIAIEADHLLIATGPDHANVVGHHPYLRGLHEAGLIMPDVFGFGLACDKQSRALARDGHAVSDLYIAGPLARGTFGELTAVSEIASQVEQIARRILRPANRSSRTLLIRCMPVPQPELVALS